MEPSLVGLASLLHSVCRGAPANNAFEHYPKEAKMGEMREHRMESDRNETKKIRNREQEGIQRGKFHPELLASHVF